jgi:hypothetical protein
MKPRGYWRRELITSVAMLTDVGNMCSQDFFLFGVLPLFHRGNISLLVSLFRADTD